MADRSQIEWTDATWNPTTGCTKLTAGCDNCYAHSLANGRLSGVYLRQAPVVPSEENAADPFAVRLWPERLVQPLKWADPRMIFVNSMSDLFHVDVPDEFVRRIFEVMLRADHHTFQVLTKRPGRALRFFNLFPDLFANGEIPAHIWLGTSVESQEVVYRVRQLAGVPAVVRFLSCEPLLGPLELDLEGIHWVIVGGESGIGYRPMDTEWVRGVQRQCEDEGVAFFFKQWGGRTPKAKGRTLDDRTWDAMPLVGTPPAAGAAD